MSGTGDGRAATLPALFQPLQVGPMRVANRVVMAPMERNFAHPDGRVSDRTVAHYRLRAEGGAGWIDVESTFVHPTGRGRTHQLGIHHDGAIEGFQRLVGAVHDAGAKIGIELHHAGRNTSSLIMGFQPLAPSPVPCLEAGGEVPHQLTVDEIDQVVGWYTDAARRAAEAGFDAVELHSAHGYLPLAFLSPLTNHRTDEYGGTPERRAFFARRVVAAMKAAVPGTVAVGCRFSAEEHLAGGLQLEDTIEYARALERSGVDYLSVSTGVYASFVRIIPPMDFAPGWLLSTAAAVKQSVSVPVIGVSRIVDPLVADAAILSGDVDLVALGRALLTDPQWPNKAREGRLDEIVSCIGCNQGCEARISRQRDVTCLVNPQVGREPGFDMVKAAAAKSVVVVGGGPAGMEVARTCAERGHAVRLFEQAPHLGGALALAARLPERPGWQTFLEQSERRLRRAGVDITLGQGVTRDVLAAEGADAVVLATGARFVLPAYKPSSPEIAAMTPPELLLSERLPQGHVIVCGAGASGLGVAAWLAARKVSVTVVSTDPEITDPPGQGGLVPRLVASGHVTMAPERQLVDFEEGAAVLGLAGSIGPLFSERVEGVGAVVWATERQPRTELRRGDVSAGEVYEIGDRRSARDALEAVYEGAVTGRLI
jgi:2,4-dienoyl-CoA reductase-like NADH-dependent reductase (Old Yellow Enzyme family)/thioredoxin reductase